DYATKVELAEAVMGEPIAITDGVIAGRIEDPASATSAALKTAGMVTSQSITTIRTTYDPAELAAPGELLLLLPGVVEWTDFEDATAGQLPPGWTARWDTV